MIEFALFAVVALFTGLAARLLRRTGPVAHWIAGWMAAGLAGFLPLLGSAWPHFQLVAHPLGTIYAALLLSGTLLMVGREPPRWLFPGALVFGVLRALAAAEFGTRAGYAMGLVCEPIAVFAAAWFAWRARHLPGVGRAERWLGPAMAILACAGFTHLAWLASGRSPATLAPLWVVVAPIALAMQIQAAADALRRGIRAQLEERVAERTAALAASEERHRTISALSIDFAFEIHIDRALNLTRDWITGGFARTLGIEPDALDGRGWIDAIDPAERDAALESLRRAGAGPTHLEIRLRRRDGSDCALALQLATVERDVAGVLHIVGAGRDVTALKEAEAERERLARHVEQVARLESLGILAGGIAHDFNNLLTVIRGSVSLALAEQDPGAPARARLERIATAAEHAAALTEEMLAYAGKSSTRLAPLDLDALVHDMADLLRASVGAHCTLSFDLAGDLPCVEADANGLRRVLLNLVLNAAESLGEKPGRVEVATSRVEVTQAELDSAFGDGGLAPGRFVALDVRDEGAGMDAETRRRVFEPFFSTKFSGRGLGMAAVLGIVQAHHGAIQIESAPGAGTRVRVLLALARAAVDAPAAVATSAPSSRGGGVVLVVDDDPGVLELAREVLEAAGDRVRVAAGGREALAILEADAGIGAMVLDLTMPDLRGDTVFRAARALRPDLPVILVTGYDAAQSVAHFDGLDGFLRKPWQPEELVAAVRAAQNRSE